MSIYLGNTEIGQIYLGSTEISEAYLGGTKVFGGGSPPTPTPIPIEYLTNTGSQYIDTGIVLTSDTTKITLVFDASFSVGRVGTNSLMVAFSNPNGGVQVYSNDQNATTHLILNQAATKTFTTNTRYIITTESTATRRTIQLDNGTVASQNFSRSVSDNSTLQILGWSDWVTAERCARGTYYSFKIYKNDVLVRDYIPVRVGQVGYFLDNVSGELFGNAGSGNFILGNDINT